MKAWALILLIIALPIAALLAAGQAITLVWLSAFSQDQAHLHSLEIRFWIYAAVAVVLLATEVWLVVHVVRKINKSNYLNPTKNVSGG